MSTDVGVYRGSFDPPHKGHFETVSHALDTGLERVVIIYVDPNPSKPFRSADTVRKHLLDVMFKDLARVTIADCSYKACIADFESDPTVRKIYQIMAADLLSLPSRPIVGPTKLAYLVLPRSNYEFDRSMTLHHQLPVKVAEADFSERHHSSTGIRSLFSERKFTEGCLSLPEAVAEVISQNNYYNPSNNEYALGREFQRIKTVIEKEIASHKLVPVTQYPLSLELGSDRGVHSLSGDHVCFIKNREGQTCFVVKIFLDHQRYKRELLGYETIKNLNLRWVKVPEILFSHSDERCAFIGMSFVQGKTLAELMVDDPEAIKLCARANVELHVAKRLPATITADQIHFYTQFFDDVCAKLKQSDVVKMRAHWLKLLEDFVRNPGFFSYTHGDPNHYNWIVDLDKNSVTYIDLSLFGESGFAINEVQESLLTFRLAARRQGDVTSEKLAEIKTLYEEEYLKVAPPDITTSEARNFFCGYWTLKIIESLTGEEQLEKRICSFLNNAKI